MKTFSQCDYVNRLERLLGLIRITICLCNYTLSTGNLGHNPTAPQVLDIHNCRWRRAGVWGERKKWTFNSKNCLGLTGTRRNNIPFPMTQELGTVTISLPGFLMSLLVLTSHWIALVVYQSTTQLTHWPLAHGFRPGPGSTMLLTGPCEGWIQFAGSD